MTDDTQTNADKTRTNTAFLFSDLTDSIIGASYRVYDRLGFGFLESVYENALAKVLREMGIAFEREVPIDVYFEGVAVGHFKADFLVERKVIIEVKASQTICEADTKQLLNYLRATRTEVGLLLHFGPKPLVQRRVFENRRKPQRQRWSVSVRVCQRCVVSPVGPKKRATRRPLENFPGRKFNRRPSSSTATGAALRRS